MNIYIEIISNLSKRGKYLQWYVSIVENARKRSLPRETKKENHHILPKSLCTSTVQIKEKDNIAALTPREHFICHKLLIKMLLNEDHIKKMRYAIVRFSKHKSGEIILTSQQYENLILEYRKANTGKTSHNKGKKLEEYCKNPEEVRAAISAATKGKKPSIETKERMSNSAKKRHSEFGSPVKGTKQTVEHKRKLSEAGKGRVKSQEWRKKISITLTGRKQPSCCCILCKKEISINNIKRHHNNHISDHDKENVR